MIIGASKFFKKRPGGEIPIPKPVFYQIMANELEITKIEKYQPTADNQEENTDDGDNTL